MATGRFIAFEGGEGVGKSTQRDLLAEWLRARGMPVLLTREPGGTPGAEAVRALLLGGDGQGWDLAAEALLFAAARADHVARLVRPALADGQWVLCDRFVDSSRAYQGHAGGLGDDAVMALHRLGSGGLMPDLALWLDAPVALAGERAARRDGGASDRIAARDAAYHEQVRQGFATICAAEPERMKRIDAAADRETVAAAIREAVLPLLTS